MSATTVGRHDHSHGAKGAVGHIGWFEHTVSGIAGSIERAVFTEELARKPGWLQRVDPRAKLGMFLMVVLAASASHSLAALALIYVAILGAARLGWRRQRRDEPRHVDSIKTHVRHLNVHERGAQPGFARDIARFADQQNDALPVSRARSQHSRGFRDRIDHAVRIGTREDLRGSLSDQIGVAREVLQLVDAAMIREHRGLPLIADQQRLHQVSDFAKLRQQLLNVRVPLEANHQRDGRE